MNDELEIFIKFDALEEIQYFHVNDAFKQIKAKDSMKQKRFIFSDEPEKSKKSV